MFNSYPKVWRKVEEEEKQRKPKENLWAWRRGLDGWVRGEGLSSPPGSPLAALIS